MQFSLSIADAGAQPAGDPNLFAPLTLAYVGDSVYDLYVRARLVRERCVRPAQAHESAIAIVNAAAQSRAVAGLYPHLTADEQAVFRRGRNAKGAHVPKNADVLDYRRATGFEAVLGFLYLDGQNERLQALMALAYDYARGRGVPCETEADIDG